MNSLSIANHGSRFWVRLQQAAVIVNGGIALFAGINLYRGNEKFYEEIAMPLFRVLPPETAHNLSIKMAKYKIVPKSQVPDSPALTTTLWGRSFSNPIGMAAGYDKHAEAIDGLFKMGFGFVEVGSVTPEPQEGNAKPRVFRLLEDGAVINRYGFNSDGHDRVYHRLTKRKSETDKTGSGILGVNLGKNKTSPNAIEDYLKGVRKFGHLADYLVVNISSPNTPGLRDMQKQDELTDLLNKVVEERDNLPVSPKPPILVKIAPDLSDEEKRDIAAVVTRPKYKVDGLIISNSTVSRPLSLKNKHKQEVGGLSGRPLKEKSLETIRDMYKLTKGQVPIVGVGGVSNGQDAYDKVKAGASLVQIYTALLYHGPPVIGKIKKEMEELMGIDGYSHISEAVGADSRDETKTKL